MVKQDFPFIKHTDYSRPFSYALLSCASSDSALVAAPTQAAWISVCSAEFSLTWSSSIKLYSSLLQTFLWSQGLMIPKGWSCHLRVKKRRNQVPCFFPYSLSAVPLLYAALEPGFIPPPSKPRFSRPWKEQLLPSSGIYLYSDEE